MDIWAFPHFRMQMLARSCVLNVLILESYKLHESDIQHIAWTQKTW